MPAPAALVILLPVMLTITLVLLITMAMLLMITMLLMLPMIAAVLTTSLSTMLKLVVWPLKSGGQTLTTFEMRELVALPQSLRQKNIYKKERRRWRRRRRKYI
jgi:hypothetical protein